jgi:hypothetical protein
MSQTEQAGSLRSPQAECHIRGVQDLIATGNDTELITDPNAISLGKAFYRVRFLS